MTCPQRPNSVPRLVPNVSGGQSKGACSGRLWCSLQRVLVRFCLMLHVSSCGLKPERVGGSRPGTQISGAEFDACGCFELQKCFLLRSSKTLKPMGGPQAGSRSKGHWPTFRSLSLLLPVSYQCLHGLRIALQLRYNREGTRIATSTCYRADARHRAGGLQAARS